METWRGQYDNPATVQREVNNISASAVRQLPPSTSDDYSSSIVSDTYNTDLQTYYDDDESTYYNGDDSYGSVTGDSLEDANSLGSPACSKDEENSATGRTTENTSLNHNPSSLSSSSSSPSSPPQSPRTPTQASRPNPEEDAPSSPSESSTIRSPESSVGPLPPKVPRKPASRSPARPAAPKEKETVRSHSSSGSLGSREQTTPQHLNQKYDRPQERYQQQSSQPQQTTQPTHSRSSYTESNTRVSHSSNSEPSYTIHNDRYFELEPDMESSILQNVPLSDLESSVLEYSPSSSHRYPPSMNVDHRRVIQQAYFSPDSIDEEQHTRLRDVDCFSVFEEASDMDLSETEFISKESAKRVFCRRMIPLSLAFPASFDDDISNLDDSSARRTNRRKARLLSASSSSSSSDDEKEGSCFAVKISFKGSMTYTQKSATHGNLRMFYVDYLSHIDMASHNQDISTVCGGFEKEDAAHAFFEDSRRKGGLDVPYAHDEQLRDESKLKKMCIRVPARLDSCSTMASSSSQFATAQDLEAQLEQKPSAESDQAIKLPTPGGRSRSSTAPEVDVDMIRQLLHQADASERERRVGRTPRSLSTERRRSRHAREKTTAAASKLREKIKEASSRNRPRTAARPSRHERSTSTPPRPRTQGRTKSTDAKSRTQKRTKSVDRKRVRRVHLDTHDNDDNDEKKRKELDRFTTIAISREKNNISPLQLHMSKDVQHEETLIENRRNDDNRDNSANGPHIQQHFCDETFDKPYQHMEGVDLENNDENSKEGQSSGRFRVLLDDLKEMQKKRCCPKCPEMEKKARKVYRTMRRGFLSFAKQAKEKSRALGPYVEPMRPCLTKTKERVDPYYQRSKIWCQQMWERHMAGRSKAEIGILIAIAISLFILLILFIVFLAQK